MGRRSAPEPGRWLGLAQPTGRTHRAAAPAPPHPARRRAAGPQLTDTLTTGKVDIPVLAAGPAMAPRTPPRYGYGFLEQRIGGTRIVGHNGGTPGYEAQLDIYPDSGHAVVVLANQDCCLRPAIEGSERVLAG